MPANWRAAPAKPANAIWLMHRTRRFCDRFALVRQQCWLLQPWGFCPKGVGAGLARELARSASKTCERDLADAPRTIVGQQQPTCTHVVELPLEPSQVSKAR